MSLIFSEYVVQYGYDGNSFSYIKVCGTYLREKAFFL